MAQPPSIDKEEQILVALALFILSELGYKTPQRKQVLRFIKSRNLMKACEGDDVLRSSSEPKWMNDLSWSREDLKEGGIVCMPQPGVWKLTDLGRSRLAAVGLRFSKSYREDPSQLRKLLASSRRLNSCAALHLVKIGLGRNVSQCPTEREMAEFATV